MFTNFPINMMNLHIITTNLRFNKNGHYLYGNNTSANYNTNNSYIFIGGAFNGYVDFPDELTKNIRLSLPFYNKPFTFPASYINAVSMFVGSNSSSSTSLFPWTANFNLPVPLILTNNLYIMTDMFANCDSFNARVQFAESPGNGHPYYRRMFNNCANFNQPVTIYAHSNCTEMFHNCRNFNSPVTLIGTNIYHTNMFRNCVNFNAPINGVLQVFSYTANTFRDCEKFNQPITLYYPPENYNFAVTAVNLLFGCKSFNSEITLSGMPNYITSLYEGLPNFDVSINIPDCVKYAGALVRNCVNFNSNVYITQNSNLTSGDSMFSGCSNFNKPVTIPANMNWFASMFKNCTKFNQPIDFSSVTIPSNISAENKKLMFQSVFENCTSLNQSFVLPSFLNTFQRWSTTVYNRMFYGVPQSGPIYVPLSFADSLSNWGYDVSDANVLANVLSWSVECASKITWYDDYPVDNT